MTLVIIPARMGSTRLPGKPLLKIGDKTIIERCFSRACEAGFIPYIASDSPEIVELFGVRGILTGECASGTDRVAAAAEIIDPEGKHSHVVNYQGDMPFIDPNDLKWFVETAEKLDKPLTAYFSKELVTMTSVGFERKHYWLHIGLYGFPREVLRAFAAKPPTASEQTYKLEQLRISGWNHMALDSMPLEINTPEDLRAARCLT